MSVNQHRSIFHKARNSGLFHPKIRASKSDQKQPRQRPAKAAPTAPSEPTPMFYSASVDSQQQEGVPSGGGAHGPAIALHHQQSQPQQSYTPLGTTSGTTQADIERLIDERLARRAATVQANSLTLNAASERQRQRNNKENRNSTKNKSKAAGGNNGEGLAALSAAVSGNANGAAAGPAVEEDDVETELMRDEKSAFELMKNLSGMDLINKAKKFEKEKNWVSCVQCYDNGIQELEKSLVPLTAANILNHNQIQFCQRTIDGYCRKLIKLQRVHARLLAKHERLTAPGLWCGAHNNALFPFLLWCVMQIFVFFVDVVMITADARRRTSSATRRANAHNRASSTMPQRPGSNKNKASNLKFRSERGGGGSSKKRNSIIRNNRSGSGSQSTRHLSAINDNAAIDENEERDVSSRPSGSGGGGGGSSGNNNSKHKKRNSVAKRRQMLNAKYVDVTLYCDSLSMRVGFSLKVVHS